MFGERAGVDVEFGSRSFSGSLFLAHFLSGTGIRYHERRVGPRAWCLALGSGSVASWDAFWNTMEPLQRIFKHTAYGELIVFIPQFGVASQARTGFWIA